MIVTIHQPEHMPWLGFFNKAVNSDIFVLLDTVQFEKNYFQNRNKIMSNKNPTGEWITVPVEKGRHTDLICEKKIAFNAKTKNKYLCKIHKAYNSHPFYVDIIGDIKDIFDSNDVFLSKLNISLIQYFFKLLDIKCELVIASDLCLEKSLPGGIVNYEICKNLGATTYLSGVSGKNYLDENPFRKDCINVIYQDFIHPRYYQASENFISNLSILDLIFSLSPQESLDVIREGYKTSNIF